MHCLLDRLAEEHESENTLEIICDKKRYHLRMTDLEHLHLIFPELIIDFEKISHANVDYVLDRVLRFIRFYETDDEGVAKFKKRIRKAFDPMAFIQASEDPFVTLAVLGDYDNKDTSFQGRKLSLEIKRADQE